MAKTTSQSWIVLFIYMCLSLFTQLFWLNFSAIDTYMESQFHMPTYQVMWLSLIFVAVLIIFSLPAGVLIDRYGFKKGIGVGVIFLAIFPFIRFIDPYSFKILLISQLGIAISQPFILNGVTKLAYLWFPVEKEGLVVGLSVFSLLAGIMVALGLTPWLVEYYSYTTMLWVYVIINTVVAISFYLFVKKDPTEVAYHDPKNEKTIHSGLSEIYKIFKFKNFILINIFALIGLSIFNSLITWLQKILHDMHNISMVDGGTISFMFMLSGIIGCVVIPTLSDKLNKRKPFLIGTALISLICITVLIYEHNYYKELINAVVLGFALVPAYPIILTLSARITGPAYAGLTIGYIQLTGNIGSLIMIYLLEKINFMTGSFTTPLLLLNILWIISLPVLFAISEA